MYPHETNALKVCKSEMCMLKKSIRLRKAVMTMRDCKYLVKPQRIHMELKHSKYAKVRCKVKYK